jgi:hypothetical protein
MAGIVSRYHEACLDGGFVVEDICLILWYIMFGLA